MRTGSSRARSQSRASSGCARAGALRTSRWSWSTRADGSTRACGTTWSCWTRALRKGTRCASSAAWSAFGTSFSSRSGRWRLPRTRTRPSSHPRSGAIPTSWTGSSSFSPASSTIPGWPRRCSRSQRTRRCAPRCARCRRRRRGTTATRAACSSTRSGWRRSAGRPPSSIPASARDLLLAAALLHDVGRTVELGPGPTYRQTAEGRLLGHVHLGLRLIEERGSDLDAETKAELLHAVAVHHDLRGAKTAEAAVLYHANQLDALAATRPAGSDTEAVEPEVRRRSRE